MLSTHLLSARVVSSALQISTFLFIVTLGYVVIPILQMRRLMCREMTRLVGGGAGS